MTWPPVVLGTTGRIMIPFHRGGHRGKTDVTSHGHTAPVSRKRRPHAHGVSGSGPAGLKPRVGMSGGRATWGWVLEGRVGISQVDQESSHSKERNESAGGQVMVGKGS